MEVYNKEIDDEFRRQLLSMISRELKCPSDYSTPKLMRILQKEFDEQTMSYNKFRKAKNFISKIKKNISK